ncbi:MAG: PKD domain-containing protein [Chitinophagaceae bacterium]|nr:PKD domain-containing protein [Chitinophagaceae bacterium]
MNRIYLSLLCCFLFPSLNHAQLCNYLLYDGFDYAPNTAMVAQAGGVGWSNVWDVQNQNNNVPGYQSASSSLTYAALQTSGHKMQGGQSYLTAGRALDVSNTGPFAPYLQNGGIGSGTLYFSFLLNKRSNNNQEVWAGLHTSSIAWCNGCTNQKVEAGYFGSASDSAGLRWWSVRIDNTIYKTNQVIAINTPTLFVFQISLSSNNTFQLYVNPTSLGNTTPTSPNLTLTNSTSYAFRSFATYLGNDPSQGELDELRIAASYACATPDNTVQVNTPPISQFVVTPNSGTIPFSSSFDASSSYDSGGSIIDYTWNFGDGTALQHGVQVNHTFQTAGSLIVSLTVTDNNNVSHTSYQTMTCFNSNGSFECPLAVQLLSMANCSGQNGSLQVNNTASQSFQLFNQNNQQIAPNGSGIQFENLASGEYTLFVSGTNGCADTFTLHVPIDSNTCTNWQPNPCDLQLGVGLEGISYYSNGRVFTDYFRNVGEWVTYPIGGNTWSTNEFSAIPKDSNGYPLVLPFNGDRGVRGVISALGFLPVAQTMRLMYDGEGTIQLQGDVNNVVAGLHYIDFNVAGDGNIWFNMPYSNSLNPVRNIRIVEIADTATYLTQPFQPDFLNKINYFKCLRFMDWLITNGNENRTWQERTKPTYYSQSITPHGGVAYEHIIALANLYKKDIWINIPHLADDYYIEQMALLFKQQLHPGIHVYLEYSNEVWNWQFAQAHYVADSTNQSISYPRRYVERATHAYRIWSQVWNNAKHRLTRILGLQLTNNYLNREIMAHADPDDYDALSPSFYVGLDYSNTGNPNLNTLGAEATPQDIIQNATNGFLTIYSQWEEVYRDARMFGKDVINYEGGQHFTNFSIPPFINAMYNAQYAPEMYTLYDRVLDSLNKLGSKLAMAFTLSGPNNSIYGSWGHLLNFEIQPPFTSIPKFQVLLDHVHEKPNALFIGLDSVHAGQIYGYKIALPQSGQNYQWQVNHGIILNGQGTDSITVQFGSEASDSVQVTVSGTSCSSSFIKTISNDIQVDGVLQMKIFIEGYYSTSTNAMMPVLYNQGAGNSATQTDSISLAIFATGSTNNALQEVHTMLPTNGLLQVQFANITYGQSVYLRVRHRNALETWTAPITFLSDTVVYDMTTSSVQAYGGNLIEITNGVFGLFSGDINQDGSIDVFDYLIMDPDIVAGSFGYFSTDLNGDGSVDAFDFLVVENHIAEGITANTP